MRKASLFAAFLIVSLAASFFYSLVLAVSLFTDGFETNFDKWTDGGTTTWVRSTTYKYADSYGALCGPTNDGPLISDNINTASYNRMNVSFWFYDDDMDNGDGYFYFYDGSSYDQISDVNLLATHTEDVWTYYSIETTDSQYFKSNFRIGFNSMTPDSGENFAIDVVIIAGFYDVANHSFALSETAAIDATLGKQNSLYRTLTETLVVSDYSLAVKATAVNLFADLSAEAAILDGLYEMKTIGRTLVDTTVITDEYGTRKGIYRTLEDNAAVYDTLGTKRGIFAVLAEAAAASDNLGVLKGLGVYLLETLDELDGLFVQKDVGVAYYETMSDTTEITGDLSTTKGIFAVLSELVDTSGSSDVTKHILNTFLEFFDTINTGAVLDADSPLWVGIVEELFDGETGLAVGMVGTLVVGVCGGVFFLSRRKNGDWSDPQETEGEGDSGVWQVF